MTIRISRTPCNERDEQDSVSPWTSASSPAGGDADHVDEPSDIERCRAALALERAERRRAQCLANIQSGAVQLALDLLVREPDMEGFFGMFTKRSPRSARATHAASG